MSKKRVHAYYSGMVHGVGFRFTAQRHGARSSVAGWVKNLADGRVEIVAEGEETSLKEFLKSVLESSLRNYIQDTEINWSEATGEFNAFNIRY